MGSKGRGDMKHKGEYSRNTIKYLNSIHYQSVGPRSA